jgi:hypothetical protein
MLEDRAPASYDLYQKFIRKLKLYWRVPIESAAFVTVWSLAFELMVLKRDLMIRYESFTSGTPVATIIDWQNQSSGMWAFSEGNEVIYLVVLIYLLWPVFFNVVGQLFKPRQIQRAKIRDIQLAERTDAIIRDCAWAVQL